MDYTSSMLVTHYSINNKSLGSITYAHTNYKKNHSDFKKTHSISYKSKQQAFSKASRLLFFNDDMIYFSTLTYKHKKYDSSSVYKDFKNYVSSERKFNPNYKYLAVLETHKDKSLHIHIISNRPLLSSSLTSLQKKGNQRGLGSNFNMGRKKKGFNCSSKYGQDFKRNLPNWSHGFSTCWTISQMTYYHRKHSNNKSVFNPLKYLFNYIKKSNDKLGGRWVYKSSNLVKPKKYSYELDIHAVISFIHVLKSTHVVLVHKLPIFCDTFQLCTFSYYSKPTFGRHRRTNVTGRSTKGGVGTPPAILMMLSSVKKSSNIKLVKLN